MKLSDIKKVTEGLEVTSSDSLPTLMTELKALQREYDKARINDDEDLMDQIEQELHELNQLIKSKK